MKLKLTFLSLISSLSLLAQDETNCAGGAATNSEAQVSYSVGIIFYRHSDKGNGKFGCGVQHAYQEDVTTSVNGINAVALNAYPNPFENELMVHLLDNNFDAVNYRIEDAQGRVVLNGTINGMAGTITTNELSAGVYLLNLYVGDEKLNSVKLIKK